MASTDTKALAQQMIEAVRAAVAKSEAALNARIDEIFSKVKEIPSIKGDPGKDADPEVLRGMVADAFAALPKPKDGKDADPAETQRMVSEAVSVLKNSVDGALFTVIKQVAKNAIDELPKPKDGKDVDAKETKLFIEGLVKETVAALPKPKDGKDADQAAIAALTKQTVEALLVPAVEAAVAKLPKPKDGKDVDTEAVLGTITSAVDAAFEKIQTIVEQAVDKAVLPAVEAALAKLPKPKDGKDVDQAAVEEVVRQTVTGSMAKIEATVKHAEEEVQKAVATAVAAAVAALPKPKDGDPGKNADESMVKSALASAMPSVIKELHEHTDRCIKEALAALPKPEPGKPGKDADPIHPDTVARMVLEAVHKVVGELPKPKDGDPGRDAISIDVLPGIDEAKGYPRGTFAEHRGGMIRSIRNTDPIGAGGLEKAGWVVSINGVHEESEETLDEGRTIKRTTTYTNGRQYVREIKTSCILYKHVWREGEYVKGDVVTWSGSVWHCEQKTMEKPGNGSPSWRLMVKEGRPGKDAGSGGVVPQPKPVRLK